MLRYTRVSRMPCHACINEVCPISFIPLHEIPHRVTFVAEKRIVYNAEDIIEWLKHYALVVPMTNSRIRPGFANEILRPHDPADHSTTEILSRAGYLDGVGGHKPNIILLWLTGNPIQQIWILFLVIPTILGFIASLSLIFIPLLSLIHI